MQRGSSLVQGQIAGRCCLDCEERECMASHKLQSVCFEVEAPELVGAVICPLSWPSYRAYGKELAEGLSKFRDWKLIGVVREVNVPAFKIPRSVTTEDRLQSYVAREDPVLLRSLLEKERVESQRS
ncbi:hypothetical protein Bca4012_017572 [Brassica carinata]